jgi:exoribonuclease R
VPARLIRVVPATALDEGIEQIKREAGVAEAFPADVLAEAEAAAGRPLPERERVELPFVTIDPPGARDLDQALHIARLGEGHRVSYAIADPGVFIAPGGPLDRDTHARGVTVYEAGGKVALHPPVLSEGAASLLPDQWRPAVLWTLDLDGAGELVSTDVRRVLARSVAQHTYEDVPPQLAPLLREVGERRLALERARGGVQLRVPAQEVVQEDGGWTVHYRVPNEFEDFNAQVSLLTGMTAAQVMLRAGVGILRTQPAPSERDFARLRRAAAALGVEWPEDQPYPEFIRGLDPSNPRHAAIMHEATTIGRGATYTPFDGTPPAETTHWAVAAPYAHATAPLRRLQDRYVIECCLRNRPDGLFELPAAMTAGTRRANAVERGIVDLVEAVLLAGREGETFDAVVIDDDLIQLREPAVRARMEGAPDPGSEVRVRLEQAAPATRTVRFVVA